MVWLETCNEQAGFAHIVDEYESDFAAKGITASQIPELIVEALENGTRVGLQGQGGIIYDVLFYGKTQRILVAVSDNGFIVTAYPQAQ